jgi:hypothetical protein
MLNNYEDNKIEIIKYSEDNIFKKENEEKYILNEKPPNIEELNQDLKTENKEKINQILKTENKEKLDMMCIEIGS